MKIKLMDVIRGVQVASAISASGLTGLYRLIGGWKGVLCLLGAGLVALSALELANTRRERDGALAALAEANRAIAVLKADAAGASAAAETRVIERENVRVVYVERKKELNEALEANADWANSPVPDGVLSSLRK